MRKVLMLTALWSALFGCTKGEQAVPVEATEGPAGTEAAMAPAAAEAARVEMTEQDWSDGNTTFGLNLLRQTRGNVVVSPFSAQRVLGMVYEGAAGDTARGILRALSMPEASNLSAVGDAISRAMLLDAQGDGTTGSVLHVDNRVWVERTLGLLPEYVARVSSQYRAEPTEVEFEQDAEGVRRRINADVSKTTEGKITDLLQPGSVDALTRLVLTNAVYFKAPWYDAFPEGGTRQEPFYGARGEQTVPMMHHTAKHRVAETEAFTAVELAFVGNYALVVLLPTVPAGSDREAALSDLEGALDATKLRELYASMSLERVKLSLPKFRLASSLGLTEALKALGMGQAFGAEADFSRMGGKGLFLSAVIQKAYIDVSEAGAEAAAATAAVMKTRALVRESKPIEVTVDHPFLYLLMERTTRTVLFMGRIVEI